MYNTPIMKLIVGLGNIGKEYANTRHNIGFMVADKIAEKHSLTFNKEEREANWAEFRVGGEKIITSFHCPYCDSLLYEDNNDGYIYCLHPNCGYKTRNS